MFLSASAAEASTPCAGFAALDLQMGRCEDNAELGEAALACVRAYRDRIKTAQATVLAQFQAQIEKMKKEQNDSFDRTQAGYENARRTLQQLIAEGEQAKLSVDDLYNNLYFPADADEPEITGKSHDDYLNTTECFATPRNVLNQSKAMIDHMRTQLQQLEQVALGKQDRSGTRSVNVDTLTGGKVGNSVGAGAGKAVPMGRHPAQSSDISGTKKAIDDAKKGDAKANQTQKR